MKWQKIYKTDNIQAVTTTIETLKQKTSALASKMERYTSRCELYRQIRRLSEDQKRFYQDLKGEEMSGINNMPDKSETATFWLSLWGKGLGLRTIGQRQGGSLLWRK